MALDQVANFVRDEVDESVDDVQTTILVADISVFPDPVDGEYNCVVWDVGEFPRPNEDPNVEIVRVTGIDASQLVVERGVEGTSAAAHPNTSEIQLAPTAKVIQDASAELERLEQVKADLEGADISSNSLSSGSFIEQQSTAGIPSHRGNYRWMGTPVAMQQEPNPTIAWILDDDLESQWEYRDEFISEGVQPELNIHTSEVGDEGRLTWEEIKTLIRDEGWGLMNGSHAHEGYDGQSREQIKDDILTAESIFAEQGLRPECFVFPQSQTQGNLGLSLVAQIYGHAFPDRDAPIGHTSGLNVAFSGKHPHKLNRVDVDERPMSEIEERIDAAVSTNKPLFLGAHEIIPGTQVDEGPLETSVGKIQDIITYARNAGMTWGKYVDALPEFPQWGINVDPHNDEFYIRPNVDNGDWFYHSKNNHHFLGGSVRLPNLPDDSGTSQAIWWDNGSGSRDEGLYTEVGGEVTRVTVSLDPVDEHDNESHTEEYITEGDVVSVDRVTTRDDAEEVGLYYVEDEEKVTYRFR